MSTAEPLTNSIKPLSMENVLDPRLEAMKYGQQKLKWGIFKGCQMQNWQQQQANSYSTAGVAFQFNTQSESTLIDRRIFCRCQFQVTIVGTAPIGQPLLNDEADAPAAFPLGRVTQALKVSINGTSFDSQYADNLEAMLRFNNPFDQRNHDLSMTPSMLDKHTRYEDGVGGVRNPLSTYDNGSYEIGRGAFRVDSLTNPVGAGPGVPVTAIVTFTVTEPLMVSPFLYSSHQLQSALLGAKNIGVQFSFRGDLSRVWSHAVTAGVTFNSVTVGIGQGTTLVPQLLLNYLTPPLLDSIGETPMAPVYQYFKTETYVNSTTQTAAAGSAITYTVTNNAIQLSTVPSSVYIWLTRLNSDKTYTTPDCAFGLRGLRINYLSISGQFSTALPSDLYLIACKNGLELSWTEWYGLTQSYSTGTIVGLTGGFMKLDVEDLAIPDNLAAGVNTNSQLSIQADIVNLNQVASQTVQCNTLLVYDGLVTIVDGNAISQVGIISQADVVETRRKGEWVDFGKAQRMYGGNFFSKLASLAKKAPSVIHAASSALKMAGLGLVGGADEEDMDDEYGTGIVGGKRRNCPKGSQKVCAPAKKAKGGASMSLAELRRLAEA